MGSRLSEERTTLFTDEKMIRRCIFKCEKNDTSNQKPQRCVSFGHKRSYFSAAAAGGGGEG